MKSSPHTTGAGNANLKGKKYIHAGCRCCHIVNLKEKYLNKLAKIEMNNERDDYKMS